jgi:myosin heavy subunit
MEASEDNLEALRNICDNLRKEVERLHTTKKEVEELRKERAESVKKVNKLSDLQKEVERLQAKEKDVEEIQRENVGLVTKVNKISDQQKEAERLTEQKGVAVYSELQKICDNEREAQDLRKYNEIKVELCRQIGLAEDYLSVSERSQVTEATSARSDAYKPHYKETPGLILELQALRGLVFHLKEAQISNGVLRRLVKEFQQVVTEHEDKINQLLIQTYPILTATETLVSHSILCYISLHCCKCFSMVGGC